MISTLSTTETLCTEPDSVDNKNLKWKMFGSSGGAFKSGDGFALRQSTSITAPEDWIIEHIAEERSEAHRYSLLPNGKTDNQLLPKASENERVRVFVNHLDKLQPKDNWVQTKPKINARKTRESDEDAANMNQRDDEALVSLDNSPNNSIPKQFFPQLSPDEVQN